MNVDSILISEFASVTDGTALTVFRTFNRLEAKGLPARVPMMFVSLIIHGHPSEASKGHEIELRLINSRREVVGAIGKGEFQFGSAVSHPPGLPLRHVNIHGMVNLEFTEFGPYAFEVYVDGTYHAGAAFVVIKLED